MERKGRVVARSYSDYKKEGGLERVHHRKRRVSAGGVVLFMAGVI